MLQVFKQDKISVLYALCSLALCSVLECSREHAQMKGINWSHVLSQEQIIQQILQFYQQRVLG